MMSCVTLPAIAGHLGADYQGPVMHPVGMAIDSRAVRPGEIFVALVGSSVDGHDYVEAAARRGAMAAIVERPTAASIPCLRVADTLSALTEVARLNRDAFTGDVLSMTGSCGKTSVKNMCRAIFTRAGATVATAGNYNNEFGVPLTLSRLEDTTRYAVVEMGAAGRGHIAHLCAFARPRITTVLNAMEAHLEGFGSVADVADIKAEIFDALDTSGTAVLNLDQPWVSLWRKRIAATGAGTLAYTLDPDVHADADITASHIDERGVAGSDFDLAIYGETRRVSLPLPGRHNVANALAAAALATAAGLPLELIARGLEDSEAEPGRLVAETLPDGTLLIDDSYNANPGSVRAAIDLLASSPGRRTLILGEMLELGQESARMHAEMGDRAREKGLNGFVGVGDAVKAAADAFGADARWFPSRAALTPELSGLLDSSDVILVKGSRGAAMESVLGLLRTLAKERGTC